MTQQFSRAILIRLKTYIQKDSKALNNNVCDVISYKTKVMIISDVY